MKNDMKIGDIILFYHSNASPPGVAGLAEVASSAYPDHSSWDKQSEYFDPKSTPENPRWFMVDVQFKSKFNRIITLEELKNNPALQKMRLVQKGNRLSIIPVEKNEFETIINLNP